MANVKYLVMVSVMFLMLGVGLRTPLKDVILVARKYQLVVRGVLANFVVVPVLFFLALNWLPFRPDVVIGLLIMGAVPGAPMALPFVTAAKGDIPYAVGLMTIMALLCIVLTPVILALCLPPSEEGLELETLQIIKTLLSVQLIPIALGMAINRASSKWSRALLLAVPKIGQVGLIISMALILAVQGRVIIELGVLPNLAAALSIVICLLLGELLMIGETSDKRRSLAIAAAIRNIALGLLIVNSNYPGTPAVAIVVVFGVLSMVIALAYGKLMVAMDICASDA